MRLRDVNDPSRFVNGPDGPVPPGWERVDAAPSTTAAAPGAPAAPDTRNWLSRAYSAVAEPVTKAVEPPLRSLTRPLVDVSRVLTQGEPISQVIGSSYQEPSGAARPFAEAVVPQTPIEAGALAGSFVAPPLAAARFAPAAMRNLMALRPVLGPALARIGGGAVGGEIAGLVSGEPSGKGAALGGGTVGLGEGVGALGGRAITALPGMKGYISRKDTERVGRTLENFGVTGVRTPVDVGEATTAAVTRRNEGQAAYEAAQAAHREAAQAARQTADEATRAGRADWRSEWQRRRDEAAAATERGKADWEAEWTRRQAAHRQAVERAAAEAPVADAALRERNAATLQDVITRAVPQLGPAFGSPGATSLHRAATGEGRRVLGAGKEAVTAQLEQAVPGGIQVPTLFPPVEGEVPTVSVRQAIDALSRLRLDFRSQLARNPADRDILGRRFRQRYGRASREIETALEDAAGMGAVFRGGQQEYKQGMAALRGVLQPSSTWTPTGELNAPGLAGRLLKPRTEIELRPKLGAQPFADIRSAAQGMSMAAPRPEIPPPVRPLESGRVFPEPPLKSARVYPDIPPEPARAPGAPGDVALTEMFGPANRLLQESRGTTVNWPAVQKAMQTPEVRAALVAEYGEGGYERLLRSVLRGASSGADVPVAGTGRLFGPAFDLFSGREKGAGYAMTTPVRAFLPNLGARYVGRHPGTVPPALQRILDVAAQRAPQAWGMNTP